MINHHHCSCPHEGHPCPYCAAKIRADDQAIHRMVEHAVGRELDEEYRPLPPRSVDTLDRAGRIVMLLLVLVLAAAFVMLHAGLAPDRKFPRDLEFETERGPE